MSGEIAKVNTGFEVAQKTENSGAEIVAAGEMQRVQAMVLMAMMLIAPRRSHASSSSGKIHLDLSSKMLKGLPNGRPFSLEKIRESLRKPGSWGKHDYYKGRRLF